MSAAKIDGANGIQTFFKITLPMLSPMLKIILMLAITGAFKDYESIMVLTNGGPNNRTQVMFLYIYQHLFWKRCRDKPTDRLCDRVKLGCCADHWYRDSCLYVFCKKT